MAENFPKCLKNSKPKDQNTNKSKQKKYRENH